MSVYSMSQSLLEKMDHNYWSTNIADVIIPVDVRSLPCMMSREWPLILPWLRLILTRPDLCIPTVLYTRCLLAVDSQVPIINFWEHFMNITITMFMTVCALRMQSLFDLLYLVVKLVPFLLCLQSGLIRLISAFLNHLYPRIQHQHLSYVERDSSLISINWTFCGHISIIFFSTLT